MESLQKYLQSKYPQRYPTTDSVGRWTVCIDDRNPRDTSADFCDLSVRENGGLTDHFQLVLHNAPLNQKIRDLCGPYDPTYESVPGRTQLSVDLTTHDVAFLRQLARSVKGLTGWGQQYQNRNWKWICRRLAASLTKFARHLEAYSRAELPKNPAVPRGRSI